MVIVLFVISSFTTILSVQTASATKRIVPNVVNKFIEDQWQPDDLAYDKLSNSVVDPSQSERSELNDYWFKTIDGPKSAERMDEIVWIPQLDSIKLVSDEDYGPYYEDDYEYDTSDNDDDLRPVEIASSYPKSIDDYYLYGDNPPLVQRTDRRRRQYHHQKNNSPYSLDLDSLDDPESLTNDNRQDFMGNRFRRRDHISSASSSSASLPFEIYKQQMLQNIYGCNSHCTQPREKDKSSLAPLRSILTNTFNLPLLYWAAQKPSNINENYDLSENSENHVNLSGKREKPFYVDEPNYVLVRREEERKSKMSAYTDDPFIPPRGRKQVPILRDILNHYDPFIPNRGRRDYINELLNSDDLFYPNRGRRQTESLMESSFPPEPATPLLMMSNYFTHNRQPSKVGNNNPCQTIHDPIASNNVHQSTNKEMPIAKRTSSEDNFSLNRDDITAEARFKPQPSLFSGLGNVIPMGMGLAQRQQLGSEQSHRLRRHHHQRPTRMNLSRYRRLTTSPIRENHVTAQLYSELRRKMQQYQQLQQHRQQPDQLQQKQIQQPVWRGRISSTFNNNNNKTKNKNYTRNHFSNNFGGIGNF